MGISTSFRFFSVGIKLPHENRSLRLSKQRSTQAGKFICFSYCFVIFLEMMLSLHELLPLTNNNQHNEEHIFAWTSMAAQIGRSAWHFF